MAEEETVTHDSSDPDLPESARGYLRRLEKENKRIPDLENQVKSLTTEKAISSSGMTLNERQTKALLASHEGDETPEAFRKTAEELGFVEPEPETPAGAEDAHKQLANARTNAEPTGDTSYEEEMAAATSKAEAAAIAAKHDRPFAAS